MGDEYDDIAVVDGTAYLSGPRKHGSCPDHPGQMDKALGV